MTREYTSVPTGRLRQLKNTLSARHGLYLSCHAILALVGLVLMLFDWPNIKLATLMVAVGASLLAMGFGGTVLFLSRWMEQTESERLDTIRDSGLRWVFPARAAAIKDEYDRRLAGAATAIDILGFGLKALREDYRDEFAVWARRAKVRILILDPDFPNEDESIAELRDREEDSTRGTIRTDVGQFLAACDHLLNDPARRFRVRLYRCLPTINLFRIDREVFWGPYLIRDVSRNMPTLLMENGRLTERLIEHFDHIWNSDDFSRDVPDHWRQPRVAGEGS